MHSFICHFKCQTAPEVYMLKWILRGCLQISSVCIIAYILYAIYVHVAAVLIELQKTKICHYFDIFLIHILLKNIYL